MIARSQHQRANQIWSCLDISYPEQCMLQVMNDGYLGSPTTVVPSQLLPRMTERKKCVRRLSTTTSLQTLSRRKATTIDTSEDGSLMPARWSALRTICSNAKMPAVPSSICPCPDTQNATASSPPSGAGTTKGGDGAFMASGRKIRIHFKDPPALPRPEMFGATLLELSGTCAFTAEASSA